MAQSVQWHLTATSQIWRIWYERSCTCSLLYLLQCAYYVSKYTKEVSIPLHIYIFRQFHCLIDWLIIFESQSTECSNAVGMKHNPKANYKQWTCADNFTLQLVTNYLSLHTIEIVAGFISHSWHFPSTGHSFETRPFGPSSELRSHRQPPPRTTRCHHTRKGCSLSSCTTPRRNQVGLLYPVAPCGSFFFFKNMEFHYK